MLTASGEGRQYNLIRKSVLHLMNNFLREVETSSPGYDLHVDFSKGFTGERLSGLFMDDGLIGMLEAADIKTVDM